MIKRKQYSLEYKQQMGRDLSLGQMEERQYVSEYESAEESIKSIFGFVENYNEIRIAMLSRISVINQKTT